MTTTFGHKKDRPSVGADEPVQPKTHCVYGDFSYLDSSSHDRIQQDILLWRKGFEAGLREGLAQGPAHPAVQQSVANFFGDWDGVEAARERSAQRFWNEYHQARDAA
jgi:hypothetical protein